MQDREEADLLAGDAELRIAATEALERILNRPIGNYKLLRALLGLEEGHFGGQPMTDEEKYKCKLLAGPHGYAIYKILCQRTGLTDLQQNCDDT